MRQVLQSTTFLLLVAIAALGFSIYMDIGTKSWLWFQRSGSVLVLMGAVLGYRSVVRLGVGGVGGDPVTFAMGTVTSVDETQSMQKMKIHTTP